MVLVCSFCESQVMVIQGRVFELALNEGSGRKTPTSVGFADDGERLFGDQVWSQVMVLFSFLCNTSPLVLL